MSRRQHHQHGVTLLIELDPPELVAAFRSGQYATPSDLETLDVPPPLPDRVVPSLTRWTKFEVEDPGHLVLGARAG